MKFILLSAFLCAAAIGGVFGQNFTFTELYEIPGADFVGFGYDTRFTEPIQAVRLPLFDWDFQELKTYRYPAHKEYRFRVPDELFVRTVARTDASNYVFGDTNEMREQFSIGAGVSFKKEKTGPSTDDMSAPEKADLLATLTSNVTSGSNDTSEIDFEEAGYGTDPFLSVTERTSGSRAFSIGAEFDFLKNNVDKEDRWITQNEQITQFYQLFVDKRKLRPEFIEDLARLKGRTWFGADRELYINFFEKYGTHVVISAMMGGAISMTSVVERTAQTDTITISSSINFQFNETNASEVNDTTPEQIIDNSPNCVGEEAGWSYSTLKEACQPPAELSCYAPMDFAESFDSSDPAAEDWTFKKGPHPQKLKDIEGETCNTLNWCAPVENVKLKRVLLEKTRWTGTVRESAARPNVPLEVTYRTSPQRGHFLRRDNSNTLYPVYQTKDSNSCGVCHLFSVLSILFNWNSYVQAIQGQSASDFISSYYWQRCFYLSQCATRNATFFPEAEISTESTSPSFGGGSYLSIDSRPQNFQNPYNSYGRRGRVIALKNSARPKLFQFEVRSDFKSPGRHNVMELVEIDGRTNRTIATLAFFSSNEQGGKFGLLNSKNQLEGGGSNYTFGPLEWIKAALKFEWDAEVPTVTLWVYEDGDDKLPRQRMTVPFRSAATSLNTIYLFNEVRTSKGSWDSFQFCNENGKSTYVPVTRASAVATSTSKFKQTLNGQIDFNFANEYSAFTFSQTSNYRLKGGDSAQVDLLDLRKKVSTFDTWKGTIIENPAPVSFVLKTIDEIVPDEEQRPFIAEAIQGWLESEETRSIIVETSPDLERDI